MVFLPLSHVKSWFIGRLWCWEGLGAGGEGDDRGWDGWMASLTRWRWVWVNSGSWWWTGRPGVLQFMGSQRVGHDWVTELNWTDRCFFQLWRTLGRGGVCIFKLVQELLWVGLCLSRRYVEVVTSVRMWPYWKIASSQRGLLKWSHTGVGWVLNPT